MTLSQQILDRARKTGATVTCAESCTGGMVAAALTDVAGSSAIFERGFVTYSNQAKQDMLGVRSETLAAHGAVSEDTAQEMAKGARQAAGATVAVAISGIAGPGGGTPDKPEGRVCFATANAEREMSETVDFGALGRDAVRQAARDHALTLILRELPAE